MKPNYYYLELYEFHIFYFIGWTPEQYAKVCKEVFDIKGPKKDEKASTDLVVKGTEIRCILIWTHAEVNPNSVMVHESHHAVSFIHDFVGIHSDHENDEAAAYLQELIYEKSGVSGY
jgi:hypothetical protein